MYIQALWEWNWYAVKIFSLFNACQFFLLAFTIIFFPFHKNLLYANAIFSIIMILLECRQVKSQGIKEYFGHAYNYLDIVANAFIITTAYNRHRCGEDLYKSDNRKMILTIGILLSGLRALTLLRIFKNFRVLIELIKSTIIDMSSFLFIIVLIIVLMAIVTGLKHLDGTEDQNEVWNTFGANLGEFYMTMLGENAEGDSSALKWLIYILFTVLVNIVALNLLIAILSNTYDNVMASLDATHLKTKVEVLDEISDFMIWNRSNKETHWLHFVYYSFENLTPNAGSGDDDGRVRVMLNELKSVKDVIRQISDEQELAQRNLNKLNDVYGKKVDAVQAKIQGKMRDSSQSVMDQIRAQMEEQKTFYSQKIDEIKRKDRKSVV